MIIDNEKQLSRAKIRLNIKNTEEDDLIAELLESAKEKILARRYPYGNYPDELDAKYADLQIRLAIVMYNMQGAEGQKAHSENGISRTYESYDILLSEVTPMVGGIR